MPGSVQSIHAHAKAGNLAGVANELARDTVVDARDPDNDRTPLMEAVDGVRPKLDLVRFLIERGADVNAVAMNKELRATMELFDFLEQQRDNLPENMPPFPNLDMVKSIFEPLRQADSHLVVKENVLSIAARAGHLEIIEALLTAGADIHYMLPHNYDVLIDAVSAGSCNPQRPLVPIVQMLISRGAAIGTVSSYGESAVMAASGNGRFDVVGILLSSGANAALLKWTPLMFAIAQGSLSDVEAALAMGPDLTARDSCLRTPWLLSVHTGDVAKARLLLAAGANRQDRGQCGKPPLMYPTCSDHADMLRWLLSEGFDPNDADDFKGTPLMEAAVRGITRSAKILIDAGADIHLVQHGESAVRKTTNLEIVRLLVDKGADLNDISDEMRSELTRLPNDQRLDITRDEYLDGKQRRFGQANPEKMNVPFWKAMVTSGANAYTARRRYDDDDDEPVWCFKRFGKSINELSDGRIIEIAGEHEDYYDPDFCIYNDVVVHHGDGTFDIYGYPKACFPPTDFHTATLVGKHVYIVGCLGYPDERRPGDTPVYRLDIETFEIQEVPTTGEKPGWIHRHKAVASNQRLIRISGGEVYVLEDGKPRFKDNPQQYALDLESMVWCKTS